MLILQKNIEKKACPDEGLPDFLIEEFNISHAFSIMCMEISILKRRLQEHINREYKDKIQNRCI